MPVEIPAFLDNLINNEKILDKNDYHDRLVDLLRGVERILQKRQKMQVSYIIDSYKQGKSAREIGQMVGLSATSIMKILRKNEIKLRSHVEAAYVKSNPNGDPFSILEELTPEADHLKAMALGLYASHGNLRNSNSVKFTNSNPAIIKIFTKFLRVICGVPQDKIKASLIIYPDVSARMAKDFWAKFLDLPRAQFSKTTVLRSRNGSSSKRHSIYGMLTLYVHNSKLLSIIKDWVKEYALVAQLVEHIHGKDGVDGSNPSEGSTVSGGTLKA